MIRGIPYEATEESVKEAFSSIAPVSTVFLVRNNTGKIEGYGYLPSAELMNSAIEFESADMVSVALELKSLACFDRLITINELKDIKVLDRYSKRLEKKLKKCHEKREEKRKEKEKQKQERLEKRRAKRLAWEQRQKEKKEGDGGAGNAGGEGGEGAGMIGRGRGGFRGGRGGGERGRGRGGRGGSERGRGGFRGGRGGSERGRGGSERGRGGDRGGSERGRGGRGRGGRGGRGGRYFSAEKKTDYNVWDKQNKTHPLHLRSRPHTHDASTSYTILHDTHLTSPPSKLQNSEMYSPNQSGSASSSRA